MLDHEIRKRGQQEILVVEDTPASLQLLSDILAKHGYRVRPASSGKLALRSVEARMPDLILLDVIMPGMDGYEVCRRLKADEKSCKIPVIFISALDETIKKVEGFEAGGVDFITKPIEPEEVLARVRTHLRLRELTEHLEQEVLAKTADFTIANQQLEQEIAEHKRAEEALRESEQRYRSLVENVDLGITLIDSSHRIIMTNSAQGRLFHKPESEFVGRECFREFEKRDAVCPHCPGVKAVATGQPQEVEAQGVRDDGSCFSGLIRAFPIFGQDDTAAGFIEVVEDITERKRAEEELKRYREHLEELVKERTAELVFARELAESANRAKSEFLAGMSHELRTPLNAIMGFAQILMDDDNISDRQRDGLSIIYRSGGHLLTLISDILDLSRIEARKMEVEAKELDLPDLIHEVLSAARIKGEEKNLSVHYAGDSALPRVVKADGSRLRQVLLNLLNNAVKYTDTGHITFRVTVIGGQPSVESAGGETELERNGRQQTIRFEVEDTGIGIPKEKRGEIFEPFTRGERDGRVDEGMGLGLAICRRLVGLMDGRLWVASEVGKGSTFTVELDLYVLEGVQVPVREPERLIVGYEGEPRRILVVDDNISNLSMLVSLLKPLGFEVETAEDGEKAVKIASIFRPDLVLLDLLMPGMDGHETLRRIRSDEGRKGTRIIGITAAVADKVRTERFSEACDDFLSKPVEIRTLLDKIKAQLQIEWIEAEESAMAVSTGSSTADAAKPVKLPPPGVVDEITETVDKGDFTGLERIIQELLVQDAGYQGFCDRIRAFAEAFDDEAILEFIDEQRTGTRGTTNTRSESTTRS